MGLLYKLVFHYYFIIISLLFYYHFINMYLWTVNHITITCINLTTSHAIFWDRKFITHFFGQELHPLFGGQEIYHIHHRNFLGWEMPHTRNNITHANITHNHINASDSFGMFFCTHSHTGFFRQQ